jgi:hypothetical protein
MDPVGSVSDHKISERKLRGEIKVIATDFVLNLSQQYPARRRESRHRAGYCWDKLYGHLDSRCPYLAALVPISLDQTFEVVFHCHQAIQKQLELLQVKAHVF